jgi:hypothetical protein
VIILAAVLIGATWGGFLARRRGGNRMDIAQYAISFGIAFGLLGLFLTVFIDRMT